MCSWRLRVCRRVSLDEFFEVVSIYLCVLSFFLRQCAFISVSLDVFLDAVGILKCFPRCVPRGCVYSLVCP